MGVFDGLDSARTFDQGNYFEQGKYLLKIKKCLIKDTFQSGQAFIVEFEVVTSDNPNHKVGSTGSWVQKMTPKEISLPAIKSFIFAVVGAVTPADREKVPCQDLADKATKDGVFDGELVECEYIPKTTKKDKKICVPIFRPAPKKAA